MDEVRDALHIVFNGLPEHNQRLFLFRLKKFLREIPEDVTVFEILEAL